MLAIVNYELHHTKNGAKSDIAMMKPSDLCLRVNDILRVRKKQRPALVHGAIPRRRKRGKIRYDPAPNESKEYIPMASVVVSAMAMLLSFVPTSLTLQKWSETGMASRG
jgi:hypothetical protein